MHQHELNAISGAVQAYFGRLTRQGVAVGSTAGGSGTPDDLPEFDYTGMVAVSGAYRGCIYFTAPKLMLRYLLLAAGETLQSDEVFLGTAGEIVQTIARNARQQCGANLEISAPFTLKGAGVRDTEVGRLLRAQPTTVICIQWQALLGALVVDLQAGEAADAAGQAGASGSSASSAASSAAVSA